MADRLMAIDDAQRTAARVAGLAYLLTTAAVVFAEFGLRSRLFVSGDLAQTVRNIAAAERLFRLSITLNLAYCVGVVVLVTALYVILKPVNRHLALLAAFLRLVYVVTSVLMVFSMLAVARHSSNPDYVRLLQTDPLQDFLRLTNSGIGDQYYVGLVFTSLASTVVSYLFLTSRYVPRALAVFGVVSSAWCVACTLAYLLDPAFATIVNLWWFDVPMALFDIALSLWLLIKGLHPA
jgi:hypothetical protein